MKISILILSSFIYIILSFNAVAAEDGIDMNMMNDKFEKQMKNAAEMTDKMSNEKNSKKKMLYMDKHMSSMKGMMKIMDDMMQSNVNSSDGMSMAKMRDCTGMGMGKGVKSDCKAMMGKGAGDTGMKMGGMMQMMGSMMDQSDMMKMRMEKMHEMMSEMLKHMDQMDMK